MYTSHAYGDVTFLVDVLSYAYGGKLDILPIDTPPRVVNGEVRI